MLGQAAGPRVNGSYANVDSVLLINGRIIRINLGEEKSVWRYMGGEGSGCISLCTSVYLVSTCVRVCKC